MAPHEHQPTTDQAAEDRALLAEYQRLMAIPDDEKTDADWLALERVGDALAERALQAWDADALANPGLNTADWPVDPGDERGQR